MEKARERWALRNLRDQQENTKMYVLEKAEGIPRQASLEKRCATGTQGKAWESWTCKHEGQNEDKGFNAAGYSFNNPFFCREG